MPKHIIRGDKLMISFIVAMDKNNVIGIKNDNKMPWHLPKDLQFFKEQTTGHTIIMGRKTFESVNKKFPGRTNIVITTQKDWSHEGVITAGSLEEALEKAKATNCKELFVIGGGEIFKQAMDMADKIYMTRVNADLDGDTFFPAIDENKFEMVRNVEHEQDTKHLYSYSFQTWKKK